LKYEANDDQHFETAKFIEMFPKVNQDSFEVAKETIAEALLEKQLELVKILKASSRTIS
jgi:hypothetical protein